MEDVKITISDVYECTVAKDIADILLKEFPEKVKTVEE